VPSIYVAPWRVDITVRDGVRSPLSAAAIARTAGSALDAAGAPSPASLAVILTDDRELEQLNEKHMGEHGPTDVLSFPMLQPSAFPPHRGQQARTATASGTDFVNAPGERQHLGDVLISVERATEQAEHGRGGQTGDVRSSVADELRLLAIHGVLHVCGWDHAQADERDAMRALENDLLDGTHQ
jgi:probable rRNA maturation factor